jgi:hypothetical protein
MKKCFFFFSMIFLACSDHTLPVNDDFNDPNWLRLEIPGGREAYAIAGSLDGTLLVTTWTKAYYTVDQGNTWIESYDFQGPVMGLLERNDTIFSLQGKGLDRQGYPYASIAQYFTVDHGNSWKHTHHPELGARIGTVNSPAGAEYFLKTNSTPVSPGSTVTYVNSTDVMKRSVTGVESISFPYKHNILNLHIDLQGRLYLAASGGIYKEETNRFYCCTSDMPAIIYVSKHAAP